jgi:sigma-B regulation protein RsbU (phosphoserine phosphatase)
MKLRVQKRLALRHRIGLLKNKSYSDTLDEVEQKMLDHELAIAEELQSNLLPRRLPPLEQYDIQAYYRPSREVGGDYYDFIEIDSDHWGILVADVSGKGIPGSIVMTETRALMKSEGTRGLSPIETLGRVNRVLHEDIKRGMFVTMFYAVLEVSTGISSTTSAGHNPMVLWRKATNTCCLVNPNGLALGIDRGPLFEKTLREQKIRLDPGNRMVLYTDGTIEAMNAADEQFGKNRFYHLIQQLADKGSSEFLHFLVKAIQEHQGDAPQHDDITIVTVRRNSAPPPISKS